MPSPHPGALPSGPSSSLPSPGHMQPPSPLKNRDSALADWSCPSMIGPSSSFYPLDAAIAPAPPDADTRPYQQWIDSNYHARQQYNPHTYAQYGDMIPPSNLYQQPQPAYESAYKSELLNATRLVARPNPSNPHHLAPDSGLQPWGNALESIPSYHPQARPGQHFQPAPQIAVAQKTQPVTAHQQNGAGGPSLQPHDRAQPAPSQSPPRPPSHPSQALNGLNGSVPRQNGRAIGPYSSGQLNIRQYEFKPQPPSPVTAPPDQSPASRVATSGPGSGISQLGRNPQKNATTNGTLKRNAYALPQSPQGSTVSDSAQRKRKRPRRGDGNANHTLEGDTEGEEESEDEDADGGISVGIKGVAGERRTGKGLRLCAIFRHLFFFHLF
jgi:hypothetical protein